MLGQRVPGAWTVCTCTMDYEYLLHGLHPEAYPAEQHALPQFREPTRVCQNTWMSLQQRISRILRIIKRSPLSIKHYALSIKYCGLNGLHGFFC